jgi:hypothetical protein
MAKKDGWGGGRPFIPCGRDPYEITFTSGYKKIYRTRVILEDSK